MQFQSKSCQNLEGDFLHIFVALLQNLNFTAMLRLFRKNLNHT